MASWPKLTVPQAHSAGQTLTVSVIIPVYNCEEFIIECLSSITKQCFTNDDVGDIGPKLHVEISIYDDASRDSTLNLTQNWMKQEQDCGVVSEVEDSSNGSNLRNVGHVESNLTNSDPANYRCGNILRASSTEEVTFSVILNRNSGPAPHGVGFARNRSVEQSTGAYLCFCDGDDIMMPRRIAQQLKCALENPLALIGTKFVRLPLNSMETLTTWANTLNPGQLYTQVYSSFGPTLVMPTWFCKRQVYDNVGGFSEDGHGTPEDLIFFYKHLDKNGPLIQVDTDEPLMIYRHHSRGTTFSISQDSIWTLRLERLQAQVLSKWTSFTIWNAGKLGRKLYRSLSPANQDKVVCFCDVDEKKIHQKYYRPFPMSQRIPIVSFRDSKPPYVICVKTEFTFEHPNYVQACKNSVATEDRTDTDQRRPSFLSNLKSLELVEGLDYFYFN